MTVDSSIKEEERKAIDELRKRMKGDMDTKLYDDIYLFLRFLRARDLNVDNAEIMLRKNLEWRKEHDIDNILNFKKTEVMEKYVPNIILGYDKEGCVIRYSPVGSIDFVGAISTATFEETIKFLIHETEIETAECKKQSEKLGKNIDRCVYIYNLEHFSFAQATDKKVLHLLMHLMSFYMNNYPERLKAVYIFNTSMYFYFVYSIMKQFLPNTILNKFHVYSDDSYKEDILKVVDADVLPKFLGGNRTDPDGNPLCLEIINHNAGKVPQSFYMSRKKKSLSKLPGVKKVTLSSAAFHEVKLEVTEPGSYLEWEFETKCRDIGFGLFFEEQVDDEEKITELVPMQRMDTEEYPETGTFRCQNAGIYVIVFDNTYSWIRSKEIYFRTKVVTPKEHEAEMEE